MKIKRIALGALKVFLPLRLSLGDTLLDLFGADPDLLVGLKVDQLLVGLVKDRALSFDLIGNRFN